MRIRLLIMAMALFLASGGKEVKLEKPYTIMIYMNGSDLESEIGAATVDLIEILESGLRSENANVVILTGGANYWQNDIIPAEECVLWHVEDGELFEIKRIGLLNMGDPDTLADFIIFGLNNFPAEKYGLVLWDHGGGAIAGFGHDENFDYYDEGSLTLPEMDYAFKKAGLDGQKLEWLGFDSCLMATVEMAQIASRYAKYLVASEDLEPGDGWDYKFLSLLNQYPRASGYLLGREIVDTFMDFYGPDSDEILTLSVTDLNKVQRVMETMGILMEQCSSKLLDDYSYQNSFVNLARRRNLTKTFGEGSPRDNESDMVDIGDMSHHLADLFPEETRAIRIALRDAVLYNRHNSYVPLYGLSAYYVYGGKFYEALDLYAQLDVDESYIWYLEKFFDMLLKREREERMRLYGGESDKGNFNESSVNEDTQVLNAPVQHRGNVMGWPVILYRTAQLKDSTQYAIPAKINGKDCDIVVCAKNEKTASITVPHNLKVLGYRYTDNLVKQKGYTTLEPGDRLAFYYPIKHFYQLELPEYRWFLGSEFEIRA